MLLLLPIKAGSDLAGLTLSLLLFDEEGANGENVEETFMLAEGCEYRSRKEKEGKGGLLESFPLSADAGVVGGMRAAPECGT